LHSKRQHQVIAQGEKPASGRGEAQRQGERRAEEERQAVARELEERVAAARRREAAERAERERMAAVEAEPPIRSAMIQAHRTSRTIARHDLGQSAQVRGEGFVGHRAAVA